MSSGYFLNKVKNMEIKNVNTENMTNEEINSLIKQFKQLHQSKTQNPGGGGQDLR